MSSTLQPADSAVQFLVTRIEEQAARDGVPLSDLERKMLFFYEGPGATVDMETSDRFDSEYDGKAYEAKISQLLRRSYKHDSKIGQKNLWQDALRTLRREDHYILVMVQQAGIKAAAPLLLKDLGPSPLMIFAAGGFIVIMAAFRLDWIPENDVLRVVVFLSFIALVWGLGKLTWWIRLNK